MQQILFFFVFKNINRPEKVCNLLLTKTDVYKYLKQVNYYPSHTVAVYIGAATRESSPKLSRVELKRHGRLAETLRHAAALMTIMAHFGNRLFIDFQNGFFLCCSRALNIMSNLLEFLFLFKSV